MHLYNVQRSKYRNALFSYIIARVYDRKLGEENAHAYVIIIIILYRIVYCLYISYEITNTVSFSKINKINKKVSKYKIQST